MDSEGSKEYSVNWKNHMSHVRKAFDHLLTSNELTDVTLCCEGKKMRAHKILLSACSAYFRDTFKEVPCQHPVIILYGVEYEVLSDILRFIYNGEVSVDTSKLDSFLKLAQMLQISGLADNPSEKITAGSKQNLEATTSSQVTQETVYTEPFTTTPIPDLASSSSDDTKRGIKRTVPVTVKQQETPSTKIQRQDENTLFISDVKCEPSELVNFEDPLEDPLQSDQSQDTREFFGDGAGQSTGEEDFKRVGCSTIYKILRQRKMDSLEPKKKPGRPKLTCGTVVLTIAEETDALEDVRALAASGKESLLPSKSKCVYENTYAAYHKWCTTRNIMETTETSILEYFNSDLASYKSSSLWSKYSMLRSTINLNENVDISKFPSVLSYLKRKSEGHKPKKSQTLTKENVDNFLIGADDKEHLLNKVILIFGVAGACHRQELVSLSSTCVQDCQTHFLVKIVDTNTKRDRSFIILPGKVENLDLLEIIRKYMQLRPTAITHNRFFINYIREKCTVQPVGVHKIAAVPSVVAKYLNLENPSSYTGHCFRRTSASLGKLRS